MKKNNSESFNSITILVTPWEKGFKCGIITTDDMFEMTDEQYELCTTIAKGMCCEANQNPDKTYSAYMIQYYFWSIKVFIPGVCVK